jgi:hypothetical protein
MWVAKGEFYPPLSRWCPLSEHRSTPRLPIYPLARVVDTCSTITGPLVRRHPLYMKTPSVYVTYLAIETNETMY